MKRAVLVATMLVACHKNETTNDAATDAASDAGSEAIADASIDRMAPLASSASHYDREANAMRMLYGYGSEVLEVKSTDPGKAFDHDLRTKVAPPRPAFVTKESFSVEGAFAATGASNGPNASILYRMRDCYEEALETKPTLEGTATYVAAIKDGKVGDITVKSKLPEGMLACTKNMIPAYLRTRAFATGTGNATFTLRFSLKEPTPATKQ